MNQNENFCDALGNPIVIGNKYGYSNNQNGITTVRLGIALKETPSGLLSLEVYSSKTALYNDPVREVTQSSSKVAIKANMVFPIH